MEVLDLETSPSDPGDVIPVFTDTGVNSRVSCIGTSDSPRNDTDQFVFDAWRSWWFGGG